VPAFRGFVLEVDAAGEVDVSALAARVLATRDEG
jgi:hypothetical protein